MRERVLFQVAVEITDEILRENYLEEACQGDATLQARLNELLRSAKKMGSFLQTPMLDSVSESRGVSATGSFAGFDSNELSSSGFAQEASDSMTQFFHDTAMERQSNAESNLSFLEPVDEPGVLGRIGHYHVLELIGQGAFGLVLKARDEKLLRIVAIKVMLTHLAQTSPARKRFLREARAGAAIRHQNIVSVYSVEEEPIPYLVMEYIQGITLQDKINEDGPLEINEVVSIGIQIANGLQAAHDKGMIHRDIKPSNILLEASCEKRAMVTDFGLARALDDASLTQSGFVAGTPMYMSPEQTQGHSLDSRSDLFSLGSVMYALLTGRAPFRATTTVAVLGRVAAASPRAIQDIIPEAPDWLCAVIAKLHAKQPELRFQSAKEVAELLARGQAGLVKVADTPSLRIESTLPLSPPVSHANAPETLSSYSAARFSKRGLRRLAIAAGALLAFCSAAAILYFTTSFPFFSARKPEVVVVNSPWDKLPLDAPAVALAPFDAVRATVLQQQWAANLQLPIVFTNLAGIRFQLIPPGEFDMGSTEEEIARYSKLIRSDLMAQACLRSESPVRRVALTKPFYLATTELTQGQYESVMSVNPSYYKGNSEDKSALDFPVDRVSWDDATSFCKALNLREGLVSDADSTEDQSNTGYCLPTEAQWEFACRAGTTTRYSTGESAKGLSLAANFGRSIDRPATVASYAPNPFGLFDMHGNLYEWVRDGWDSDYYKNQSSDGLDINPIGPDGIHELSIVRGGDFYWDVRECRSSARYAAATSTQPSLAIGIRLAISVDDVRGLLIPKESESKVLDFVEIHGASLAEFERWQKELSSSFIPILVNQRFGCSEPTVDAVAVSHQKKNTWELHVLTNGFHEDWEKMRPSHIAIWRMTVPASDAARPETTIALWLEDNTAWNTQMGTLEHIKSELEQETRWGSIPVTLNAMHRENDSRWEMSAVYNPGVGHHEYFELKPGELIQRIEAYRNRGWRPQLIQLHTGGESPIFTAVFRENSAGVDWEFASQISEIEYTKQLSDKKASGFYPACLVSYVEQDEVVYSVVWQKMNLKHTLMKGQSL